mmetsp:Transcript_14762/g.50342  ORF Transcript_14762/g.50342 Transcript_14762/m.50342 type:complete len:291 (-) Transcript_14762:144-1016(-)
MDETKFARCVLEACEHARVGKTAREKLAKDFLLLFYGLRSAVLIDYLPLKSIHEVTDSCLERVRKLHEDFSDVFILHLCEDNYFLIHVQNSLSRLQSHLEDGLGRLVLVNCSKGLQTPYTMEPKEMTEVVLTFTLLIEKLEEEVRATSQAQRKIEMEDESFALLLPTIAGWILEYPVVYFVDDILSGNSLGMVPLHLYRLEVKSEEVADIGWAPHHVLSFSVPKDLSPRPMEEPFLAEHLRMLRERMEGRRRRLVAAGDGSRLFLFAPACPAWMFPQVTVTEVCLQTVAL